MQQLPEHKNFVIVMLSTTVIVLIVVAATSLVVNPYGLYPTGFFSPIVWDAPSYTVKAITETPPTIDVLVLGSSRVAAVECTQVQAFTGLTCLNATTPGSFSEDQLAILQYYLDQKNSPPQIILYGLEVRSFPSNIPWGYQIAKVPQLNQFIDKENGLEDWAQLLAVSGWTDWGQLISMGQFRHALLSLYQHSILGDDAPPGEIDLPREVVGDQQLAAYEQFVEPGEIDQGIRLFLDHYAEFELSPDRLKVVEQIMQLSEARNIHLVVFTTPVHSQVLSALDGQGHYPKLYQQMMEVMGQYQGSYTFDFYDFSTVDKFGGQDQDFVTADHLGLDSPTAKKLVNTVLRQWGRSAQREN